MRQNYFVPETGRTYNNHGGGSYKCLSVDIVLGTATMQNTSSKWTLIAHGVGIYEDGSIDWDYSTGGNFAND